MDDQRRILMSFEMDWTVPGGELVIQKGGITSRIAAGELTGQLIPAIAIPHLEGELRTVVEMVNKEFGMTGLRVVELAGEAGDVREDV